LSPTAAGGAGDFLAAQGSMLTVLDSPSWEAARRTWLEVQEQPDRHTAIAFLTRDRCGVLSSNDRA
jgi:hypothetical protein